MVPLKCRYVHYKEKYRHYSGNRHYSTYCHYWLFPSVPRDFAGNIVGNRHNSIGTLKGPLRYIIALVVISGSKQVHITVDSYDMTVDFSSTAGCHLYTSYSMYSCNNVFVWCSLVCTKYLFARAMVRRNLRKVARGGGGGFVVTLSLRFGRTYII